MPPPPRRVAAAHAARSLPQSPEAVRVVRRLLDDSDLGVVKSATRAAVRQADPALAAKARRASARMATAVRKALKRTRRERMTAMATKARKKAAGASRRKASAKSAAGGMPTGAMIEPPKRAKARAMPAGKMR